MGGNFFYNYIYFLVLVLAVLGFHCSSGSSLVAARGFLTAVASLAFWSVGSRACSSAAAAPGL